MHPESKPKPLLALPLLKTEREREIDKDKKADGKIESKLYI